MRKADRVESEHIGVGGAPSHTYPTAKSLWNISSIQTLVKFTDDNNPIVRCYAFLGLIEKEADKKLIREILDKYKDDTTKVSTMDGCIVVEDNTVAFYMQSSSSWYLMDEEQKKKELERQKQWYDSLFTPDKKVNTDSSNRK